MNKALIFLGLGLSFFPTVSAQADDTIQAFTTQTNSPSKQIEYFYRIPGGPGPFPAFLYLHGHQEGTPTPGGQFLETFLVRWQAQGFIAVAVSQPGYGNSTGPRDFCGPATQAAVEKVISTIQSWPAFNGKMVIGGTSRGAIVASMVAAHVPDLSGVVLQSGSYQLNDLYRTTPLVGIADNIANEAGLSSLAISERSALLHVRDIKSPVLLLHGTADERLPFPIAKAFLSAMQANGNDITAFFLSNGSHFLPADFTRPKILEFVMDSVAQR